MTDAALAVVTAVTAQVLEPKCLLAAMLAYLLLFKPFKEKQPRIPMQGVFAYICLAYVTTYVLDGYHDAVYGARVSYKVSSQYDGVPNPLVVVMNAVTFLFVLGCWKKMCV